MSGSKTTRSKLNSYQRAMIFQKVFFWLAAISLVIALAPLVSSLYPFIPGSFFFFGVSILCIGFSDCFGRIFPYYWANLPRDKKYEDLLVWIGFCIVLGSVLMVTSILALLII